MIAISLADQGRLSTSRVDGVFLFSTLHYAKVIHFNRQGQGLQIEQS
jgi:hypothetical protein